jgi:1,6-anhydro-N-acetylmuramate kinase
MTGTSMDGVDAVAVQIDGVGETMSASFYKMASCGLGSAKPLLQKLAVQGGSQDEMDEAATLVGKITAEAISKLELNAIDLIALHGQTVFHNPPKSMQLINPRSITEKFNCTIFTDPRQHDLQLGGQGAPITPLADWIMFRSTNKSTAIVNLGGFCNVTVIPANCSVNQIHGFDVCCCNLLLNAIAKTRLGVEFDCGGKEADKGSIDNKLFQSILNKLEEQREENRSLGTYDDFTEEVLRQGSTLNTQDLLATTASAIGACITESTMGVDRVLLAGGGVHNQMLTKTIHNHGTTNDLGVPTQAREAMAMAILGALAQDNVSITLPQITGRRGSKKVVGWVQVSP